MHRKRYHRIRGTRWMGSGLLLGAFLLFGGCVKPLTLTEATNTPVPTVPVTVAPTAEPEPALPPEITTVPETPTTAPAATKEPLSVPESSPTPTLLPTPTPEVKETPTLVPEISPEPDHSPTPFPEPTGSPDYAALLQNGWQRTGDFFGYREIFFSGKWSNTELIAIPGRYEYRYTAASESGSSLSVIGEEAAPVQLFLDELTEEREECRIEPEGETDFCYFYTDDEVGVNGRVYACFTDGTEHRMRVELRYPVDAVWTESCDFYLR